MKKSIIALLSILTTVFVAGGCSQLLPSLSSDSSSSDVILVPPDPPEEYSNTETFDSSEENSSDSSETSSDSSSSSSSSDKEEGLQSITVAEFLAKKDESTFYKLTGVVTKITNTTYGNFVLEDDTGSIFVWGLYPEKGSTDKYGFSSLNIQVGDTIEIAGVYYYYEKDSTHEVKDAYFISKISSGNSESSYLYTDFTQAEKALFTQYIGEVVPFAPNNEYYVEGYYEESDYEHGINFYTIGNTQADFNAYLTKFSDYDFIETYEDDYGDTWYCYEKADVVVDVAYYSYDGENYIDLFVYSSLSTDIDDGGNTGGGTVEDENVLTNAGKGLPQSANGVYDVDFTKAAYVKNVTEQGYYLDGCPTLSTSSSDPAVLVVPVEFSDLTATSKGYTVDKIEKAFKGGDGDTSYYSVHDYYYLSSYGKLDLDITVLDYWFRPQYSSSYYKTQTMDYGGTEIEIGDQMIIDEILQSLESSMDLTKFDSDGNGVIDSIVLITTLDIDADVTFNWAYRYWNMYTDEDGYYYEYDGVSANDYLWAPYRFMYEDYDEDGNLTYDNTAIINTYTYIHEFGHVLGADDYYDTAYVGAPMDGCDIMDSMTGDHNAFTKFNFGWLTSSRLVVAEESVTLTLEDFSKNGDTILIANNWDESLGAYQEYYILVYYTNNGLNGGDYGYFARDGVVVYHVNASLYKEVYDGETYYDIYNNNTDPSDEYGTEDNLIEYVKSTSDTFTYIAGDTVPADTKDDRGNTIAYTFTVDSLTSDTATITFTKNA